MKSLPGYQSGSIDTLDNQELLQGIILGDILYITINITGSGSSEIVVCGEYEGDVEYSSFTLTVTELSADDALGHVVASFQADDYVLAANYFTLVISKNLTQYNSDAYMGLGFS